MNLQKDHYSVITTLAWEGGLRYWPKIGHVVTHPLPFPLLVYISTPMNLNGRVHPFLKPKPVEMHVLKVLMGASKKFNTTFNNGSLGFCIDEGCCESVKCNVNCRIQ